MFQNSQRFLFPFSPGHPGFVFLTPSPAHHMTCQSKRPGEAALPLAWVGSELSPAFCVPTGIGDWKNVWNRHAELKANT